jgi:SAM-dependent methyltransferase
LINGIARFVPADNYSASFGFQWNIHAKTQLDRYNGLAISRDRFFSQTGWLAEELAGMTVLECGSGAGRFTDVIAGTGAKLYTIDYSNAVDANASNNFDRKNVSFAQASLYELPFEKNYFDYVVCFGVIQHTPDPAASIRSMIEHLRPGGRFCFDAYAAPMSYLHPRHVLRPFTKRMPKERLYGAVARWAPRLLPLSTALHKVPRIGECLARLVPVANWRKNIQLPNEEMYREWAVLDTFDWLSPAYETPQSRKSLDKAFQGLPLTDLEITRSRGLFVVRGKKAQLPRGEV